MRKGNFGNRSNMLSSIGATFWRWRVWRGFGLGSLLQVDLRGIVRVP